MTKVVGERIAIPDGAMLIGAALLGAGTAPAVLFKTEYWAGRGELVAVSGGRGAAWFVGQAGGWVLRHYRRGGLIARLSRDLYVWTGESRVRAFAEWRLLRRLHAGGLPVPRPIAAGYTRTGLLYRCDLITERIADSQPLSAALEFGPVAEATWREVGAAMARLHSAGVDHADLNAHNILLAASGAVSVIDFDRGRMRAPGAWAVGNLRRLHRSLKKVSSNLPAGRFSKDAWERLLAGYASAGGDAALRPPHRGR